MKKFIAITLSLVVMAQTSVYAVVDNYIYSDPVQATYSGKIDGAYMVENLAFSDANEDTTRMGALNVVKGNANTFRRNQPITNVDALVLLLRMQGLETQAQTLAPTLSGRYPNATLDELWGYAYLTLAQQNGYITNAQLTNALVADQTTIDPNTSFMRDYPASREQLAAWITNFMNIYGINTFQPMNSVQGVYNYSDFLKISADKVSGVETVVAYGIMEPIGNTFNPKGQMLRGDFVASLANIEGGYYTYNSYQERTGTVSSVRLNNNENVDDALKDRDIYIRNSNGTVDVLKYENNVDHTANTKTKDAPVYKNGVTGLNSLAVGDSIEYIVNTSTNEVMYVQDKLKAADSTVVGVLQSVDFANNTITLKDGASQTTTYPVVDYYIGSDYMMLETMGNYSKKYGTEIPYGSKIKLTITNNVVYEIQYVGQDTLTNEIRGVVLENNPAFGYLVIIDNNKQKKIYNYYSNDVKVEKQLHYDEYDEIGYYDELFPSFKYDSRDMSISEIEAGDIVYILPSKDDSTYIDKISASTNYTMSYGKIVRFVPGELYSSMLIEFENGRTSSYEVPNNVYISKDGVMISPQLVEAGDYAKILINQAILEPGYVQESVKELVIEGDERYINSIVKGQYAGIDKVQNSMIIKNSKVMTVNGWSNYNAIQKYDIRKDNVEIYHNGKRVTYDFLQQYMKQSTSEAYIAIQNNYAGEVVKKITLYDGRDTLLEADTVVEATGKGQFTLLSNYRDVTTDIGSIVVRNGRLVDTNSILPYDNAQVALNGGNKAAVVNIYKKIDNTKLGIARGRILSVNEGNSFVVKSMVLLENGDWIYTPVEREFEIDYDTVFVKKDGTIDSIDKLIDYTTGSTVNNVYNIIIEGTKAKMIVESPYAKNSIRGTVYEVTDTQIKLKDALIQNPNTKTWEAVSKLDNTVFIKIPSNSVIIKDSEVVGKNKVEVGNQLTVMTDNLPAKYTSGMELTGYVITVDK